MEPDLRARVEAEFAPADRDEAWQHVASILDVGDPRRVPRYVLDLAAGDLAALRGYVQTAREDWRDIVYWREDPEGSAIDTPEKRARFRALLERLGLEPPDALADDA